MDTTVVPQDTTGAAVLLVVAVLIPAVVDLVTKREANAAVKAWALAFLSLLNGVGVSFLTAHNAGQPWDWKTALFGVIASLVTSAASLFALLKPLGISGADGVIANAVPAGVGAPAPAAPVVAAPIEAEPVVVPDAPQPAPVVDPGPDPAVPPVGAPGAPVPPAV